MGRPSKRTREIAKGLVPLKLYSLKEAVDILRNCTGVKFDQSVDISLKIGVDPRRSDQHVRGTVSLPNGTGKTVRIVALARGDKVKEALAAGANYAGNDELCEKIAGGWTDFDTHIRQYPSAHTCYPCMHHSG